MSKNAQTDEIDELVSSVRDFVSHKEPQRPREGQPAERLVLTDEQLVIDEMEAEDLDFVEEIEDEEPSNVLVLNTAKASSGPNLEATIAELEAAVTAQPDEWEADEGESFAEAEWAESAFPSGNADSLEPVASAEEVAPEALDEPEDVDTDASPEPGPIAAIDQDALRALVVDIVHDELSGALGERITRNVRKLVRREINRVLTSREMGQD